MRRNELGLLEVLPVLPQVILEELSVKQTECVGNNKRNFLMFTVLYLVPLTPVGISATSLAQCWG